MASFSFFSKLIFLLLVVRIGIIAAEQVCGTNGNFTNNSAYQRNLQSIFSSISENTQIDYGFYNFSAGQDPDRANVVALCRGDLTPDACRTCVNVSYILLSKNCTYAKEAIGWYGDCMLRYSNSSNIFRTLINRPNLVIANGKEATNKSQFTEKLRSLMANLTSPAVAGDGGKKYAAGEVFLTSFQNIYGLLECTPDLSEKQCATCLNEAINELPNCCGGKVGARVFGPACNIRYEMYNFYETWFIPTIVLPPSPSPALPPSMPPPESSSPPPPPSPSIRPPPVSPPPMSAIGNESNNTTKTVIITVVALLTSVLLVVCICFFLRQRKPKKNAEIVEEIITVESLQFDFSTIKVASNDFSDANKLGQGGFGAVYKGTLPDGRDIAVKRLSTNSEQGDVEFKNEVILVAKLQHRNLVRLLGFCLEGIERLLIYEFVPNASLDLFLFDQDKRANLNWVTRYKIIGGIARGLLYLHEDSRLRIIHRDLKASNIMLDAVMNPKISDFGMAKLFAMDQTQGNTSRIVGTYGYMAPEYAMHGQFSVKSDVFSFGVLVLEIVTGQKNICFRNGENVEDLLSCAWTKWRDGTVSSLVDPILRGDSNSEIMRCIHIGLLCVQENVSDRPTMASVSLMLNSNSLTLHVPSQPSFFMHNIIESETPLISDNYSANEVTLTELYPR